MYELIKLFFDISIFKKGPQDVPNSRFLLHSLILIYICISFLTLMLNVDVILAISQIIVEIILILGFSSLVLFFSKKTERYIQTVSALFATNGLISIVALVPLASMMAEPKDSPGLSVIVVIFLMVWHWLVSGHIFRHAMDQNLFFGLGVAFLYILVSYQMMVLLFPSPL